MTAPVIWFGGKSALSPIIAHLVPPAKIFVEPFGGAASVLIQRTPSSLEVYNDIDNDLVNLFRAIQDTQRFNILQHRLTWTLFSRAEFGTAVEILKVSNDKDARAWAFFVVANQGIAGNLAGSWSRSLSPQGNAPPTVLRWQKRVDALMFFHRRFRNVQIENKDAFELIQEYDSKDTAFYVDPPYLPETRQSSGKYKHEISSEQHEKLLETLLNLNGSVVLSSYPSDMYFEKLASASWERREFKRWCSSQIRKRRAKRDSRVEVLWRNPKAVSLCKIGVPQTLFD